MKIAMLGTRGLPATHGGVERAVEELSVRLVALGCDVTVYCRPGYCASREESYRGVRLRYLPAMPGKHFEAASHSFMAACSAARGRYDVVHVHSIGPALFSFIPRLAGKKVVVTVHALDWKRRKWGKLARIALKAGAWAAARLPHATITVSRRAQRYFEETYGERPAYIPNGVTLAPASGATPATADRQLLFLGRLVPEKRVDDLIAAFRSVPGRRTLVIAGGGTFSDRYVGELRRLAEGDGRIRFAGEVYGQQKEALFAESAALINPSDLEGHPIVVLEALSRGLPVLLSDIEEHREILEAEGAPAATGLLFRTGDREDLRRGIEQLDALGLDAASRGMRREFSRTAFDWDNIAACTLSIYAGLMAGAPLDTQESAVC